MNYAIHKKVPYDARAIERTIGSRSELPDVEIKIYSDGWVIAEPKGLNLDPWKRRKEEYMVFEID